MNKDSVVQILAYDRLEDFLIDISYGHKLYEVFKDGDYVFRGQSSDKYQLIPSALRPEFQEKLNKLVLSSFCDESEYIQIEKENHLLRDFFKYCDRCGLLIDDVQRIRRRILDKIDLCFADESEEWIPEDLWQLAALAQHYGLPTRLLDWTQDLFIGLYFSIEDYLENRIVPEDTKSIVLWALSVNHFLHPEVSEYPLRIVKPKYHNNPNLLAQKGLFTLWKSKVEITKQNNIRTINISTRVNRKPLDELLIENPLPVRVDEDDILLYKIVLPVDVAKGLFEYLRSLGYDASRIYPGYSGCARALMQDYYLKADFLNEFPAVLLSR